MAIILSPGAIAGLAFAGGLLLMIVGSTTAILIGRRRHKRAIMLMNARGVRRLSGYPGGHVSMADSDWLDLPRTRTLRSSTRVPFRYPRPYTPIASRESLPRDQTMRKPPGAVTSDSIIPDSNTQQPSWPLPRRLARSSALPLVHMRGHSLSPVTERTMQQPWGQSVAAEAVEVRKPRTSPSNIQGEHGVAIPTGMPVDNIRSEISPNGAVALTPKPLFHDRRRSASYGALPKVSKAATKQHSLYVVDSGEPDDHHARLPRSTSLCAQQAMQAPTEPLPPLPLHIAKLKSFQNIRSPTEHRGSGNSLLSGNTSVLDDGGSKCFSQAETDLTSISMASPQGLGSIGLGIAEDDGFNWDLEDITGTSSPLNALKQTKVRPQLQTQNSFRASVQQSLPRSPSSGLSLSLLDQSPFRTASSNVRKQESSPDLPSAKLKVPRALEAKTSIRRGVSPSSPLSRNSMSNIPSDANPKRFSAVLQDISGNQGSPLHDGVKSRPLSIATSDPFQWETEKELKPGKPSAMKGRVRGHKRNSCVRISNIPVYIPSPGSLQPTAEEQDEKEQPKNAPPAPAFTFGKPLSQNPPLLRPPSRPTFDPQLTPTPRPRSTRLHQFNSQARHSGLSDSPTFSLLNLHNPSDSDSTSPFPTPTRKPSHHASRNPGANPNRRKPIFDAPTSPSFIFATPEKKAPPTPVLEAKADFSLEPIIPSQLKLPSQPKPKSTNSPESQQIPKPSSTLFPFPSPPHPRGPRALPPTAWRRSNSRSPTRVAKMNLSGSWSYTAPNARRRGSKDLRKSVIALRRMNSEAQHDAMMMPRLRRDGDSGESGKGHKRYLSLGDDDDDENEGFEILETMGGDNSSRSCLNKEIEQRQRERSESSLAFERVVGLPTANNENVFSLANADERSETGLQIPEEKEWRQGEAGERGGDLYDGDGFLRDGRRSESPARMTAFPIF